ncbi:MULTISPECIES: DM13 domain-containing protein [Chryseobacterium]|uniref:Electron transfer DM13 n=1 Tax=Chryseobacterium taihuense TaxID=1141221 RepID=A0A4U8WI38_9FLAO|nr:MULTISPECIES: DM13 domain-containing protein [Chryseobacterium]QQV02007.1 DM13 domain-containing protein [Chryseobacterium sp. FDAARGOS 1104]VFB04765.1 Electron transfer DM13 [Chryseobacterium taihuense]
MKIFIKLLLSSLFLVSCIRENTSTEDLMEMAPENSILKFSGNFMQGPYGNNVNGKAEIYEKNGTYTLVLNENFTISNGPDLYIYVSKEQQPSQFISLGKLKSVNGGQTYTFMSSVNFEEYKYAVVHCQQYNHLFSYASLQKQ